MGPTPCVVQAGHWHLAQPYCNATPAGGLVIFEIRAASYDADIRASAAAIPPHWTGDVRFSEPEDVTPSQRYLMRVSARYRMFRKRARWRINV